ncbi:MAG: cytochrome c peroxidase [Planctomycetota bacterium]|nr:cytochrome c peroxidase [Planctomycetota bacterium]
MTLPDRVRARFRVFLSLAVLSMATQGAFAFQGPPPPPPIPPAPPLPPVLAPIGNPITEPKRVLGKILFWEEQLSSDNTVSCGTCHLPEVAGADPRLGNHPGFDGIFGTADDVIGSPGVIRSDVSNAFLPDATFGLEPQVTGRAAPTYFSMTQYSPEMFWDGRGSGTFLDPQTGAVVLAAGGSLESQAVGPILNATEMGHDGRTWAEVIAKLQDVTPLRLATNIPPDMLGALSVSPTYPDLFLSAFGTSAITAERIGRAIATYERTLVPNQSPYDLLAAGVPGSLTPGQLAGFNSLVGSLCAVCHTPPFFTDFRFHNLGLRPGPEDIGRQFVTGDLADLGRFRTPSLRNAGQKTALMHVGWVTDVRDAIDFYNAPAFPATAAGHTQFTADQSLIPAPGGPVPIQSISVPAGAIPGLVDFISNALTDPRTVSGTFPFDRPTLHSESVVPNPEIFGASSGGSSGPMMLANTPLARANPDFKIGIGKATAGATAWLFTTLSPAPSGSMVAGVPLHLDLGTMILVRGVVLGGTGSDGHATLLVGIPDDPAYTGLEFYGQWFVQDPGAPFGLRSTEGARWLGL